MDLDKLNMLCRPTVRLAEASVGARELAPGSISADKLAVNLNAQLSLADNSVTTNKVVGGAITEGKLADEAVGASKIKPSLILDSEAADSLEDADLFWMHRIAAGGPPVKVTRSNALRRGYALLRDVKAAGTQGGTFTKDLWVTRTLTTLTLNDQSLVSALTGNVFTIPTGRYLISARAPGYSCDTHKCRLWNVTTNAQVALGTTEHSGAGQSWSEARTLLELAGTTQFRLEHRCKTTQATNGLGIAANFGVDEVYAEVEIWRIW